MKRMTKTIALILALVMLLSFGALAATPDEAVDQFTGKWQDSEFGTAAEIKWTGSAFSITLTRPQEKSLYKYSVWIITGLYSEADDMIHYSDCLSGERTYTPDGKYTDSFTDENGSGNFRIFDGKLFWTYDSEEGRDGLPFTKKAENPSDKPADKPKDPTPSQKKIPFTDVKESDYFYDAVVWCYENKITAGVSETQFDPTGTVTRAQVVSFLWRMAGEKTVHTDMAFVDVESGSWYEKAVQWAVAEGITVGTGEGKFSPSQNCTRGQVITFLYRMFGEPKPNGLGAYTDVPANAYYAAAVNWATEKGIITDATKGVMNTFIPNGDAKRQDMIVFLYQAARLSSGGTASSGTAAPAQETVSSADFLGTWADEIAGRGMMTIASIGSGYYTVTVRWSNSAADYYSWAIFAQFKDGKMEYTGAQKSHVTYTSATEYTEVVEYTDGSGSLSIESGKLVWLSDKDDVSGSRFIKAI